jgi:hypothetical protein
MFYPRVYSIHWPIPVLVGLVELVVEPSGRVNLLSVLDGLLLLLQLDFGTFFQSEL